MVSLVSSCKVILVGVRNSAGAILTRRTPKDRKIIFIHFISWIESGLGAVAGAACRAEAETFVAASKPGRGSFQMD